MVSRILNHVLVSFLKIAASQFDFQNQQSQNYTICSTLLIRVMSFFSPVPQILWDLQLQKEKSLYRKGLYFFEPSMMQIYWSNRPNF